MAIKVIIRRRFKEGGLSEASNMLIQARQNAMKESGYISSETLKGCDDPNEILVLSTWRKLSDWQRYEASPVRRELEGKFEEVMDGPSQCVAYELGLQGT